MRKSFDHLEEYRLSSGPMRSGRGERNGAFFVSNGWGATLSVICSDGSDWAESGLPGEPWEHVSVSTTTRCPRHEEMELIRGLFFEDDETVVSFSVAREKHINYHSYCLHMWRPTVSPILLPPGECVGQKGGEGNV